MKFTSKLSLRSPKSSMVPLLCGAILAVGAAGCMQPKKAVIKSTESSSTEKGSTVSKLSERFIGLKDGAAVQKFLEQLKTEVASYDDTEKYFAYQILMLEPFEGIFQRLKPLVEKENKFADVFGGNSTRILHSAIVSMLRHSTVMLETFDRGQHWRAVWEYLTLPVEGRPKSTFATVSQFQEEFLIKELLPMFQGTLTSIEGLRIDETKVAIFDRRMYLGADSFPDDAKRFEVHGAAESNALLARMHKTMHDLLVSCSYNEDALPAVMQRIGNLIGFNAGFNLTEKFKPDGVSAEERKKVVTDKKFAESFVLKPTGAARLNDALAHLRQAIKFTRTAWNQVQARGSSEARNYSLPNKQILAFSNREDLPALVNLEKMILSDGPVPVQSLATRKVINVNFTAMYKEPAQDLRVFLPTLFSPEKKIKINGNDVVDYGGRRATQWNAAAYSKFFVDLPKSGNADITPYIQVLSENWGGAALALPVMAVAQIW